MNDPRMFLYAMCGLMLIAGSALADPRGPRPSTPSQPTERRTPNLPAPISPALPDRPTPQPGTPLPSPGNADRPASTLVHFKTLDSDNDGIITRTEAVASPGVAGAFSQLDADGSGTLSPAEFSMQVSTSLRFAESGSAQAFLYLDANQDGALSRGEAGNDTQLKGRFGTVDANRDGNLSLPEYIASNDVQSKRATRLGPSWSPRALSV